MAEYVNMSLLGLYKKKSKDGTTYLSGEFTKGIYMSIFPNKHKVKETQPDYYVSLSKKIEGRNEEERPQQKVYKNYAPTNQEPSFGEPPPMPSFQDEPPF